MSSTAAIIFTSGHILKNTIEPLAPVSAVITAMINSIAAPSSPARTPNIEATILVALFDIVLSLEGILLILHKVFA